MKRLLLLLALATSFTAFAQTRQKSFTFDFTNPESLIPSVTRSPEEGGTVILHEPVFHSSDGCISLSFLMNQDRLGACIVTNNANNGKIPYLRFGRFVQMIVSGTNASINRVRIPGTDMIGALIFDYSVPETSGVFDLNAEQTWHEWSNTTQPVEQLCLVNNGVTVTHIHSLTVDYELPRDIFRPVSVIPADGGETTSFTSVSFTFGEAVTLTDDAVYTLVDDNGTPYTLTAVVNGNVLTLSVGSELTTLGHYTITVEAGSLANSEDYRNATFDYSFTVVEPVDTFNPETITPAEGNVQPLPNTIVLTFPDIIGFVNENLGIDERSTLKDKTGRIVRYLSASRQGDNEVLLTFDNNLGPVETGGKYTLTIPEKLVYNIRYDADATDLGVSNGARYNKEKAYTFIVGDDEYPSAEVLAKAELLLADKGAGFPLEGSSVRTRLEELVANGVGSDATFNAAINAFMSSTDIAMPATGEYYHISSVNKDFETELFLKYDGSAVSLTLDPAQAAVFKATANADGTTTFATLDGKYLHQLVGTNNYNGTSILNITGSYSSAVNNLQVSRLIIDGYAAETTYGLFSIFGSLGTNTVNTPIQAYALVNAASETILTDPSLTLSYFTNTLTNAFRIREADKTNLLVPDAAYTLNPPTGTSMDRMTNVTLTFPNIETVTLADASKIYLLPVAGQKILSKGAVRVQGATNAYSIPFGDVPAGNYVLTIEKGAFTYMFEQTNVTVQTITASYNVRTGVDFLYDFLNNPDLPIYFKEGVATDHPIHDVDLNNLTFYSIYTAIKASTQEVVLKNLYTDAVVTTGHFIETEDPELPNAVGVIKVVLEKEIEPSSIYPGTYVYIIQPATFGDANFGLYLEGNPAVEKSDCHVNNYLNYPFTVDNEAADAITAINEVGAGAAPQGVVYDLQGRRVQNVGRPGIYVKNGRKFVVK